MGRAAGKTRTAKRAGASRSGATARDAPGGTGLWWGGLGCGAMVVMSPASAILLAALAAPVLLVALLPEDGGGRRVALAALLFGLAGSVNPLRRLWEGDATVSAAIAQIHQPIGLLGAWTAILTGWFVAEIAGIVLKLAADLNAASKRRACMAELAALEDEWGPLPPATATAPEVTVPR